ncbi:histone H1.1, embryonic-like [Bactrocera neohumeralis]|uniref:histone H1.1, embryonic-like n=1 Tax=Bactrocera neohumeralis TaxID=98809 RepID=UPI0021666271|nr:histone H1.1, embryonic-like [Bactrocera neohumeralis]
MATENSIDVFSDSWIQIGALMPGTNHTEPKMSIQPMQRPYLKRRSVASKTMVKTAIKTLTRNPRVGVSFMAIKKFIEENYSFTHTNKRFYFVKRYIRNSLEKGELIRTKGVGVSGSFRLPFTKRVFKKKRNKKKPNINKRKRKVRKANINKRKRRLRIGKAIQRKVRKQMKEMKLNDRSRDAQLSGENAIDATACNTEDPKQEMSNVVRKLNDA